jgi:hypothetical protein
MAGAWKLDFMDSVLPAVIFHCRISLLSMLRVVGRERLTPREPNIFTSSAGRKGAPSP